MHAPATVTRRFVTGTVLISATCICFWLYLFELHGRQQSPELAERQAILDLIISDILLNPELKHDRDFYGTPGDRRFALVTDSPVRWPEGYVPSVPGYEAVLRPEFPWTQRNELAFSLFSLLPHSPETRGRRSEDPRLLGIRLDSFDLDYQPAEFDSLRLNAQVVVTVLNVGGDSSEIAVIGGTTFGYNVIPEDTGFRLELVFAVS